MNLNIAHTDIVIWPNPVHDVLNIKVTNYEGKILIKIFDEAGNKLNETSVLATAGNVTTINTNNLKSGVYVISLSINGVVLNKPFIK